MGMQTIRVRILLSRETDLHRSSLFLPQYLQSCRIRDVETRNRGTRSEARQGLLDRHPRKNIGDSLLEPAGASLSIEHSVGRG